MTLHCNKCGQINVGYYITIRVICFRQKCRPLSMEKGLKCLTQMPFYISQNLYNLGIEIRKCYDSPIHHAGIIWSVGHIICFICMRQRFRKVCNLVCKSAEQLAVTRNLYILLPSPLFIHSHSTLQHLTTSQIDGATRIFVDILYTTILYCTASVKT